MHMFNFKEDIRFDNQWEQFISFNWRISLQWILNFRRNKKKLSPSLTFFRI